jgi:hypothetical protein
VCSFFIEVSIFVGFKRIFLEFWVAVALARLRWTGQTPTLKSEIKIVRYSNFLVFPSNQFFFVVSPRFCSRFSTSADQRVTEICRRKKRKLKKSATAASEKTAVK